MRLLVMIMLGVATMLGSALGELFVRIVLSCCLVLRCDVSSKRDG